jgi:hypothetical protein
LQPFFNANIKETQTIPKGCAVVFPPINETPQQYLASGIDYNGTDTITIKIPGLYSLTCVLCLAENNPGDNFFYVEINHSAHVAGTSNLGTTGQIVLTRVGYFETGTTLRIINASDHTTTLSHATGYSTGTGHISIFRLPTTA